MALHVFQLTILPRHLRSDALRGEFLQLVPEQMKKLRSDITQEDFYEYHKRLPGFQAVFNFKKQLNC